MKTKNNNAVTVKVCAQDFIAAIPFILFVLAIILASALVGAGGKEDCSKTQSEAVCNHTLNR